MSDTTEDTISKALIQAIKLHQSGDLKQAASIYSDILQVQPDNADALHFLGLAAYQIGNTDTALSLISRAASYRPNDPNLEADLGNLLLALGRAGESVPHFEQSLAHQPDVPEVLVGLGQACLELGQIEKARQLFQTALSQHPDHVAALQGMLRILQAAPAVATPSASPPEPVTAPPAGKMAQAETYRFPPVQRGGGKKMSAHDSQQAIAKAVAHHQSGQLQQAETLYRQVLASEPNHADALHLLGLLAHQAGDNQTAVELMGEAARLSPKIAFIHNNLGMALQDQGNLDAAMEQYRQAIALDPKYVEPHMNLGTAYQEQGNLEQAAKCHAQAIKINPGFAKAHNNLGKTLAEMGKTEEGITHIERAIELDPNFVEAQNNLGALLFQLNQDNQASPYVERAVKILEQAVALNPDYAEAQNNLGLAYTNAGKFDDAIKHFEKAIALKPGVVDTYGNLGAALVSCGKYEQASSSLERALALNPDFADAHNNLGAALNNLDKPAEAIPHFERALALKPDDASIYLNFGTAYRIMIKFEEAIYYYEKALSLKPDYSDAINNLATILQDSGKPLEAVKLYERAIELSPEKPLLHWNFALSLLTAGMLSKGWEEFSYRWQTEAAQKNYIRPFPQSWWDGSDLSGKTILLWGEMGVGDEIMFAGIIPDVMATAKHCIFESDSRLIPLFSRSFPGAEIVARTNPLHPRLLEKGIDYHAPMGDLLRTFRKTLQDFPQSGGFLVADPDRTSSYRAQLNQAGPGIKVGFSWRSRVMTHLRKNDFTELSEWGPIFSIPGVVFVNLQYGECQQELDDAMRQFGITIHTRNDIDLMNDLDGAAALTAACDLIISAPTSVSAMAGALGVSCYRMISTADWASLGSDQIPFFPSITNIKRPLNADWKNVLQEIAARLRLRAEGKS
jgi:tetratricopeptide (TPR) repeat protein